MKSLEQLDKWIAGKVRNWASRASGAPQTRNLLEMRRDILEDIRDQIEPQGQGRNAFPYNRVSIQIAVQNPEDAGFYQAALSDENGIEKDVKGLLTEANCIVPSGFSVTVVTVTDAARADSAHPYHIEYSSEKAVPRHTATPRPAAILTVIQGQADVSEYSIASDRVNLGRLKEVLGEKDGLRRRNDLAFADSETTVSREHAYIRYDPKTGAFRLYDSQSQRGTSIFREGRRLEVPRGSTRGTQLQSGDEIHLGEARVRLQINS